MVRTILALQMHFCNQIRRGCRPHKLVQLRPQLLYRHLPAKQVSVHRSVTNIICIQDQALLVSIDLTICTMEQAKRKQTIVKGKNNFIFTLESVSPFLSLCFLFIVSCNLTFIYQLCSSIILKCTFCRKSSVNGKNAQYMSEDEFEFPKLMPIRAQTAPPRPLTEIEEFRRSSDFLLLENTVMMSDHLKQRTDDKYDLDSDDG